MAKYNLCNVDIDKMSEAVNVFLSDRGLERRNVLRACLILEELLLDYQEKFGAETEITMSKERRLRSESMVVRIPGESFDPFSVSDEQAVLHNMLTTMGIDPVWHYKQGCNYIVINSQQKPKLSSLTWIVIAVVLGFACGFAAQLLPGDLASIIANNVLAPLSDTIMSFLSGVAMFLIFFSVIIGLCGMGDMATFQRIGGKMLAKFLSTLGILSLVAYVVLLPFFPIAKAGNFGIDFGALYEMILDIVPGNIVEPFITGNTIQIIFISICFGIASLILSMKVSGALEIVRQLNEVIQHIIGIVIKLLPIVVFISIFQLVATKQLSMISTVYRYPLLMLLTDIVIILVGIFRVSITKKVSPLIILKKAFPCYAVALATASSVAVFPANVEVCEQKLGIQDDLVNVGLPLGQVMFMPGSVVEIFCVALCMGHLYDVPISAPWLVTLFIIAYIFSIAMPPLPGTTISCHILVLAQLGIPAEAIAVVIAFDALVDRLSTVTNIALLQTELIQIAGLKNKLDIETLRKP